jgi:hypothetical protein
VESEEPASDELLVGNGEEAYCAARATRRYLDLLRDALLDEHYLENELRIEHLLDCFSAGRDVDLD